MKIFILGGIDDNAGPTNVNRQIMYWWDDQDEIRTNAGQGIKRLLSGIKGVFWADCVIQSGGGTSSAISVLISRGIRKPYITIVHGFLPYENEINGFGYPKWRISLFLSNLQHSQIVVSVSNKHKEFIAKHMPSIKNKLRVVYNGIEQYEIVTDDASTREHIIAVSGGTRPIKNNDIVLKAIEKLNQENFPCTLKLYGHTIAKGGIDFLNEAQQSPYVEIMGQVSHSDFLQGLQKACIFIQNSSCESFGLSAIDALQQGCSLLVSNNCGVNDILELEVEDIIMDTSNVDEITRKIRELVRHPNARRLVSSIEYARYSWKVSADLLRQFCLEVVDRDYSNEK